MISSVPYLSAWLNSHPDKKNKDSSVWVNVGTINNKKPMNYENIRKFLKLLFIKAGINKKCNPHLFRHSRATYLTNHLTEFQMNQYFGWIQGSDMPSTYVHMSGREVDSAIMSLHGMRCEKTKEDEPPKPIICHRCDTINSHDARHCSKYGGVTDLKYTMELEIHHFYR